MPADLEAAHGESVAQDGFRWHPQSAKPDDWAHEEEAVYCHKTKLHERQCDWVAELVQDDFSGVGGKRRRQVPQGTKEDEL